MASLWLSSLCVGALVRISAGSFNPVPACEMVTAQIACKWGRLIQHIRADDRQRESGATTKSSCHPSMVLCSNRDATPKKSNTAIVYRRSDDEAMTRINFAPPKLPPPVWEAPVAVLNVIDVAAWIRNLPQIHLVEPSKASGKSEDLLDRQANFAKRLLVVLEIPTAVQRTRPKAGHVTRSDSRWHTVVEDNFRKRRFLAAAHATIIHNWRLAGLVAERDSMIVHLNHVFKLDCCNVRPREPWCRFTSAEQHDRPAVGGDMYLAINKFQPNRGWPPRSAR
jgi:hypothetical protein